MRLDLVGQASGHPVRVSWAGNDQLAFEWQTGLIHPPSGQHTGYRLIGVRGAGSNLLAGPAIASPAATPNYGVQAALVTPDGKDVITSEEQNFRTWTGRVDIVARVIDHPCFGQSHVNYEARDQTIQTEAPVGYTAELPPAAAGTAVYQPGIPPPRRYSRPN